MFAACNRNDDNEHDSQRNDSKRYDSRHSDSSCSNNNSNEENADWEITTKVKSALLSDSTLSASARFVSVTTNNGVVTLTGNVHSSEESRRIERKVKSVTGVRKVDNQLTVNN